MCRRGAIATRYVITQVLHMRGRALVCRWRSECYSGVLPASAPWCHARFCSYPSIALGPPRSRPHGRAGRGGGLVLFEAPWRAVAPRTAFRSPTSFPSLERRGAAGAIDGGRNARVLNGLRDAAPSGCERRPRCGGSRAMLIIMRLGFRNDT